MAAYFAEEGVRHIALDGKSLRRAHNRDARPGPLRVVSARASELGLALGQLATDPKSNGVTAIPGLLDQIDVQEVDRDPSSLASDAMGRECEIASKNVSRLA